MLLNWLTLTPLASLRLFSVQPRSVRAMRICLPSSLRSRSCGRSPSPYAFAACDKTRNNSSVPNGLAM